jgi:hypothetical protein
MSGSTKVEVGSDISHSALRTPHSALRIPGSPGSPLHDSLLARLDDDAIERVDGVADDDDRDDWDEQPDESEDGLDLWSVLYGLE